MHLPRKADALDRRQFFRRLGLERLDGAANGAPPVRRVLLREVGARTAEIERYVCLADQRLVLADQHRLHARGPEIDAEIHGSPYASPGVILSLARPCYRAPSCKATGGQGNRGEFQRPRTA